MVRTWCLGVFLISICAMAGAYKIPQGSPLPVLRNTPFVYRGPVFIVQETEDPSEPYIAQTVEGGIEMVQPTSLKSFRKQPHTGPTNDSVSEVQDDPEYFAVLVTPDTVAQAQIPRSTTITIPLPVLLLGVSSRIPWVMVLKRKNHFDYFRNPTPVHLPLPQRRRNRSHQLPNAQLITEARKYDLLYSEDEKNMVNGICASIVQELVYFGTLLQNQDNETESYNPDPFDQPAEDEASTNLKTPAANTTEATKAKPLDDQSLEEFLKAVSALLNNSTQTTTESSNKEKNSQ